MTIGDELQRLGITASNRVLKRAQYEAFEFSLFEGDIIVRNASHANPSEHEYRITIQDGRPIRCSCPADAHYKGACKHRVGVALRRPILEAASEMRVLTDGGQPPVSQFDAPELDNEECACADLHEDIPCWECVRTGKRSLPE
ncbi:SWIM zinc finger family protein [Halobacterium wangiae]|uniref:SWIM zinc finger family protein n=1 Tax=Halobacterium wangiae TaxID=2902623 RepID=UPI001E2918DB|nr:SWIM zinc finger family protein [Halobacterium wangiae]